MSDKDSKENLEKPYKLKFSDVLKHRKQVKAAVKTANLVTGDQVKAVKVKPDKK